MPAATGAPAPEITIRRCVPGDEHALSLVGQATFLETFAGTLGGRDILAHCAQAHAPAQYRKWLSDPRSALWLVEAAPDAAPVGYMVVAPAQLPLPDAAADDLEIKRVYLLGRFRGGGIGKRLVAAAQAHARETQAPRLLLGVYAHNQAAIAFYRRAGFERLGARTFSVGGRDYDDHIMGMRLDAR